MYETISVEERNTPAVGLIYKDFANDARSAASSKGMPVVRLIPEAVPSEWTEMGLIDSAISEVMDDVVKALTRPLTTEEKSPKPKEVEPPSRIIFRGALGEINQFFYRRGWTDGFPIMPPTEAAVAEMLTGTDLPPDHIVAKMSPRMGKATVEKIAINAVMAGALPTYMPLLIAGVQAQTDPGCGPTALTVSTHSFAPLWVVNGPIRKDLNINGGYGALSPGDIANATIGRALGLITKNIRGVRKGMEDMGVLGNPGRYTMVVAENEEDSPWEPLHVEHGFKKEDNAVTLSFSRSFGQLFPYGTDDKGIVSTIVYNIMPEAEGLLILMITPPLAKTLGDKGWSKKELKNFIIENARTPWYRHPRYWAEAFDFTSKVHPVSPQDSAAIIAPRAQIPDPVRIFVAGGTGTRVGLFEGSPRQGATKKVDLPANWDSLVKKYKDMVPSYFRY